MHCKKEEWTLEQWIELGNKAKEVREGFREIMATCRVVCDGITYDKLSRALHDFNMWRSEMDNIVCRKIIEGNIANKIFYGDEIKEQVDNAT